MWCTVVLLSQKRLFERFWRILSSPFTVPNYKRTRAESMFWKGSSARAISPQKIASLCFQTSQQRGRKIHASSRPFRSKNLTALLLAYRVRLGTKSVSVMLNGGLWTVDCGLWTVDCGLRTADCGLRTADCGLRTADQGVNADWV